MLLDYARTKSQIALERVAADGKILLPNGKWVHVAGLTREEVENVCSDALTDGDLEYQVRVKVTKR